MKANFIKVIAMEKEKNFMLSLKPHIRGIFSEMRNMEVEFTKKKIIIIMGFGEMELSGDLE